MKDLLFRAFIFALAFYAIYKTLEKKGDVKRYNDLFVFFIVLSFLSGFKLELFLSFAMFFLPIFLFIRWRKNKWSKANNEPIQYAELPQFAVRLSQENNEWCKQNNYDPKKLVANRNKLIEFYSDNNFEKRLRDLFKLMLHPAGITKYYEGVLHSDPYPFITLEWVLPILQEFFSSGRHQEEILFDGKLIDPYFNRSYGIEYQHEGYNSRSDKIEKSCVSFSASLRNYNDTIDYPIGEFDFTLAEPFMKVDVYDNSPYRELLYSFTMHNIEIYGKRRLRKV